ncbi:MAG: HEAT repeat domain-containing protein [Gemmataceae bacterium]|nr:HEAT repeat domain-containing protein [Gemmataceae bacterium]MDW8266373.1 HEAT repeat domain-containing protein [Gemmataceae bacterium]
MQRMPLLSGLGALGLLIAAGLGPGPHSPAAPPFSTRLPPIQVPPGFVVDKVAGPPLVEHPIMACFDERGRLFVAEAAGVNLKAKDLLQQLPNSIRLLEDTDGDGRFDRHTVFADKMTFPMGVLWHDGALYTCSPPSVWKLQDTDGDGRADVRTELVTKFGFTGNAADIHGPFLGPDGRFYWTDGRHGHQIERPDGTRLVGKAARIFRCKPDGTEVEVVCGGGMDDPVGMAFTDEGEAFATVDILHARPTRNDGIIYCIEGGVFPYHDVIREFRRTGELLPASIDLGWVAPSGLMLYRSEAFGPEYRGNLLCAQFNTHRVSRHVLSRDGAGFRGTTEEFFSCSDPDFHPTDVLEDADGSILVIDTGGWFREGCPTSQIAKPEIKGAIYRVRRKDALRVADPRGQSIPWDRLTAKELTAFLDDPRFAVRDRAVQVLSKRRGQAESALREVLESSRSSVTARRNAVWALTRLDTLSAQQPIRQALADPDPSVRLAAAHSVGLRRDRLARPILTAMLAHDTPAVRRQAATALGRFERSGLDWHETVPALLAALEHANDRFLEHALIYALIQIADPKGTATGLTHRSPRVRKGAVIALDQMAGGDLRREQVVPLLQSDDPALLRTAWGILTARPEWAEAVVRQLSDWLARGELSAAQRDMLRSALVAFARNGEVQQLVAQSLASERTGAEVRILVLESIAEAALDPWPASWLKALGQSLKVADDRVVRHAVATLRARNVTAFDDELRHLGGDANRPAELRVAALAAATPRLPGLDDELFAFLKETAAKGPDPLLARAAADALGSAMLTDEQLEALLEVVAKAGPLSLPPLLPAYERSGAGPLGQRLVKALEKSPGLPSVSLDLLERTLRSYPDDVRTLARPILKKLEADASEQQRRLDQLAAVLAGGDAKAGRAVFAGPKAACLSCHAVRGEGGRIGPDLSKIGAIRSGRDLLEAIVFPSASFVRGYEPVIVATVEGKLYNGIVGRDAADAVVLVTAERTEVRIPRASIEAIEPGKVSLMPQGLEGQLTRQELRDLIAYLLSLK